ncbi:Negative regulator of genetic competence ClpC/MecB [compost metagenome]
MQCENCQQRPATFHYAQTVNGRRRDVNLCAHCAEHFRAEQNVGGFGALGFGEMGLDNLIESVFGSRPRRSSPANLLDRLTPDARRILEAGAERAAASGVAQVGPEAVLLAALEDERLADTLGRQLGLNVGDVKARLQEALPTGDGQRPERVRLTARLKRALQVAYDAALTRGAREIGVEHLLAGILTEGESVAAQVLAEGVSRAPLGAEGSPMAGMGEPGEVVDAEYRSPEIGENLAKFTRDLSALAKAGKLDPVVGRETEIERVVRILSRRTKNNPVLIGEPGVGKTAIAEGLAQRIISGDVPDLLKDKIVLALDLGGMVAGTKYRGEFEERLKGMMDEIKKAQGKIILFIDELHTILGAGAAEGAMDAANMLKPALSRGEIQAIGATTLDEYRKHIEKDAALERRFQPVLVEEPTPEQAIEILKGLKDLYEAHHCVTVEPEALIAAVELADKYVMDRFLPDKAIDLLDEACAMKHLAARREPGRINELNAEIERLNAAKDSAARGEEYDRAREIKGRIDTLQAELDEAQKTWRTEQGKQEPVVGVEDIAKVVSEWTGIPAEKMVQEEKKRLLEIESHLHQRVIGQEQAITAVAEAVRRSRTGMKDPNRPIGSFIFLGPTGVGKTELAKALAEYLFNDQDALIRFDMSEYQEKHTVSRLVGAPPGYVGYEEAGQLTEAIRRKPYSVVLFDEIEKAHPDVFNILLQMMDDGRITDSKGKTVDCKNTVIIMTSNVGAHRIFELEEQGEDWAAIESAAMEALKANFRPEFLNRVDEIVVFHPLNQAQISEIVDLMLEHTRRKVHAQHLEIAFSDAAKAAIAEKGFDPTYGARPLRRAIQKELETRISRLLLEQEFQPGDRIRVDFADGTFTFFREERDHEVSIEPAAGEKPAAAGPQESV